MRKNYKSIISVFLLMFMFVCFPAVSTERFLMTTLTLPEEVITPAGLLRIVKDKEEDGTFNILLSENRIDQTEGFTTYIHGVYPSLKDARLVLIGIGSGGSGCPLSYKLVEIKDNGSATVTDEFGNCNGVDDIRFKNGAWHLRFPGSGNLPSETWDYRNGKIKSGN